MATECTQEAVLHFLTERGGRVKNVELIDHFRSVFPSDPGKKALVKDAFKGYVDNVAFVKTENGEKSVRLKKKYRESVKCLEENDSACNALLDNVSMEQSNSTAVMNNCENMDNGVSSQLNKFRDENVIKSVGLPKITCTDSSGGNVDCLETVENDEAKQEIHLLPASGYGTTSAFQVESPPDISENIFGAATATASIVSESRYCPSEMGNRNSCTPDNKAINGSEECLQQNKQTFSDTCIPEIAVIEASPLPGTMFSLPQQLESDAFVTQTTSKNHSGELQRETDHKAKSSEDEIGVGRGSQCVRRRTSRGSQRSLLSNPPEDAADEGHFDSASISGSDSNTPKGSRKNFIELMMNSSPQVRRSMVLRNSVYLSARCRDSVRSDSDSASVISSTTDDESAPVTLDPVEHEWMMCASDGEWESLHRLLTCEPNLIVKKDFVTGFTCLHWAAKWGNQELLALLVNFAKHHAVAININARSSAGYTPLHLAAMHNHVEVVKLLVGAYDADVEVRDYSGKKACQYLKNCVAGEILDIIGAGADSDAENADCGDVGRWRLSKVLHSNLKPLKLLNHSVSEDDVCDSGGFAKAKPLRRKSSLSKMKPRLHKIRFRTQIVHSTSFFEKEKIDESLKSPLRSRPKSNLFG